MRNKQGFVPILILLALVIFGLVAYFGYSYLKPKEIIPTQSPAISIKPDTTSDPTLGWKKYTNTDFGFELKLPVDLEIVETPILRIGDRISVYLSANPEECRGDCNIIDKAETKSLGSISVRYISGWWGEVGGNIAQSYVAYVIPRGDKYLIIQLQELPLDAKYVTGRKVQPIEGEHLSQFNQILSTFKFID